MLTAQPAHQLTVSTAQWSPQASNNFGWTVFSPVGVFLFNFFFDRLGFFLFKPFDGEKSVAG